MGESQYGSKFLVQYKISTNFIVLEYEQKLSFDNFEKDSHKTDEFYFIFVSSLHYLSSNGIRLSKNV